jgi:hypothetical protein
MAYQAKHQVPTYFFFPPLLSVSLSPPLFSFERLPRQLAMNALLLSFVSFFFFLPH